VPDGCADGHRDATGASTIAADRVAVQTDGLAISQAQSGSLDMLA